MHHALCTILNANISGHCNIYDTTAGGGEQKISTAS